MGVVHHRRVGDGAAAGRVGGDRDVVARAGLEQEIEGLVVAAAELDAEGTAVGAGRAGVVRGPEAVGGVELDAQEAPVADRFQRPVEGMAVALVVVLGVEGREGVHPAALLDDHLGQLVDLLVHRLLDRAAEPVPHVQRQRGEQRHIRIGRHQPTGDLGLGLGDQVGPGQQLDQVHRLLRLGEGIGVLAGSGGPTRVQHPREVGGQQGLDRGIAVGDLCQLLTREWGSLPVPVVLDQGQHRRQQDAPGRVIREAAAQHRLDGDLPDAEDVAVDVDGGHQPAQNTLCWKNPSTMGASSDTVQTNSSWAP